MTVAFKMYHCRDCKKASNVPAVMWGHETLKVDSRCRSCGSDNTYEMDWCECCGRIFPFEQIEYFECDFEDEGRYICPECKENEYGY